MKSIQNRNKYEIQQVRMEYAINKLTEFGIAIENQNLTTIQFIHKGHIITLYPWTGWFTGKCIVDGRGISNLIKQLV